ncbi:MAG: M15 family metallopeptidase [Clostridia bacterium]|nr:M15 family metallopeptidase [Clostridia bacterium]
MAKKKFDIRIAIIAVLLAVLLAVVSTLAIVVAADLINNYGGGKTDVSSQTSSIPVDNTDTSSTESEDTPSIFVTPTGVELDTKFSRLLLINGSNPLPDDYDTNVRDYLVEIDENYRNNNYVTQIHKDIYPYITAMVAAAQADGVDLKVWSPFRSYSIQNDLFQRQVERVGGDEAKAATVVARPGTSEHNTGLCADFNMADDAFEQTAMFTWMCENAEDYGFILRYPEEKQSITGVIYESWHWRFVGIEVAKEMNSLGMTLEEYVEYKNLDPTMDMYTDDSASKDTEQIKD